MDEVAERAGLEAVINCVLNRDGQLLDIYYGKPKKVLEAASKLVNDVYGIKFSHPSDIVVVGTYPADIEFWQAHKALYVADAIVKDGGTIIVITPCSEGLSVTHPDLENLAGLSYPILENRIDTNEIDDRVAAAAAIAWAKIKERANVSLISDGISKNIVKNIGFTSFPSHQDAFNHALKLHGETAHIAFIPFAPECLPIKHK
jgi:nickel-dependent lactate racemase